MPIDHGMNIAEVRALAHTIDRAVSKIQVIENELNHLVGSSRWVGPHAVEFKTIWWPRHRTRLRLLRSELREFGRAAIRNVDEQSRASEAEGHRIPIDSLRAIVESVVGHRGADLPELLAMLNQFGVLHDLVKGLKVGNLATDVVTKVEMAGPVASAFGALCLIVDGSRLIGAIRSGNTDTSIRRAIDVTFDAVGLFVPAVFLGKGVWDAVWMVGTPLYKAADQRVDFSGAFIDSVIRNQYGGNLKNGVDLAHRYDGVQGFFTYLGDGFTNVWKGWK